MTYSQEFEPSLESLPEVKNFLTAQLKKINLPSECCFDLQLAVEEVFANIYRHGQNCRKTGKIVISLMITAELVEIEIIDQGIPFDLLNAADPDLALPFGERQIGGLGVFLVKQLVDDVCYRRVEEKNILTLIKYLSPHQNVKE